MGRRVVTLALLIASTAVGDDEQGPYAYVCID